MDETEARRACEELIVRYTHIADFGPRETMVELFTDDAIWTSNEATYDGRDEIDAFFSGHRPPTKSRHVSSNMLVTLTGPDTAEGFSYFTLYRHTGEKPRVPDLDGQPLIVGEYRDQFRLTDGGWKIARREADVGFVRRSAL